MKRIQGIYIFFLIVSLSVQVAALPAPDVKHVTESKFEFKGPLGLMMRLFGGNKPTKTVTYLKGNVLRSDQFDSKGKLTQSQILDLDRGVLIQIDHQEKQYSEISFAEWKKNLEAMRESMQEAEMEQPSSEEMDKDPDKDVKWDIQVDIETPGDTRKIAGYQAEKVILRLKLTADVKERNQETGEMEDSGKGGINVISTIWVSKNVPGFDEMKSFQTKLAEKLGYAPADFRLGNMVNQLQESYPQLAAALERFDEEKEKLDGVPLETHTVFESWGESRKQDMDEDEMEIPKSVGGLFKGLGKKLAKKKKKNDKKASELLKTVTRTLELKTDALSADLFAVPQGYQRFEMQ